MAKATEKTYVVGDKGYLVKGGKVVKTGEKVSLTAEEFKNVEHLVLADDSKEAKALAAQEEADAKAKAEALEKAELEAKAKAEAEAAANAKK